MASAVPFTVSSVARLQEGTERVVGTQQKTPRHHAVVTMGRKERLKGRLGRCLGGLGSTPFAVLTKVCDVVNGFHGCLLTPVPCVDPSLPQLV